ncbi:MAG: sugar transporter [Prevotella sp.]|nr:sugar transporter [Prevotella sp.]
MREASRTKRTLQNSRMSLVLFLVQIFVGFYSRKIFLDYLGTEVLGLNNTLGNILSFMNLAELGIGVAMATSLYKPIHEEDQKTICEIISVQGWLYRRVALLILIAGFAVMALLPFIFPNTECGLAYVYSSFVVFLFGTLTSYWWNYRQVLISADQKNYKLQPWMHVVRYAVMGLQIFSLCVLDWGIWGWLFWTLVGNVVTVFVINAVLKNEYPWLHQSRVKGRELLNKYHQLIVMTKQLFVHKLATFVLEQTTPLVIYAYVSLSMVTHYANYMIIVGYVATSVGVVFAGMSASIGSLVAENNKRHTLEVFWELLSSRLWIAALACYAIYLFVSPFICLWIGSSYLLNEHTLLLILVGAFIRLSRSIIDSFKDAYQLFADVWAPAVEAIINLGGSILLGYLWGLNGILFGSNLSLVLIVLLWKPYYLFSHGFKTSSAGYYVQYAWLILILLLCAVGCNLLIPNTSENNLTQMLRLFPVFIAYAFLSYIILYATSKGMRQFTQRIINIITH